MTEATRLKTGGRQAGTLNKRTQALIDAAEAGISPGLYALSVMRDEASDPVLRMQAAKLAAQYVHQKPSPEPRFVTFELPEKIDAAADLLAVHASVFRAIAAGELPLDEGKELSAIIETQRRLVETVQLESRIAALEERQS